MQHFISFHFLSFFFSCVRKDLCGSKKSGTIIRNNLIAFEDRLSQLVSEAELAECGSDNDICCHEDNVKPDIDYYDEDLCSDIPDYS